MKFYNFSIGC